MLKNEQIFINFVNFCIFLLKFYFLNFFTILLKLCTFLLFFNFNKFWIFIKKFHLRFFRSRDIFNFQEWKIFCIYLTIKIFFSGVGFGLRIS